MGIRLGWENTDPHLAAPLHLANDGSAGCFDLTRSDPARFQCLQTKLTEAHLGTTQGFAPHATAHLLAPLYTFWHQHNYYLIKRQLAESVRGYSLTYTPSVASAFSSVSGTAS